MSGEIYTADNLLASNNPPADEPNRRKSLNTAKRAERRKIQRDGHTMYMAMAKVGGLESAETRATFTLSSLCYDIPGQDYDTAREITLARIGAALSSRSDDDEAKKDNKLKEAWEQRARRNVGPLFNHVYPRVGRQFLTRYPSTGEGAHKYVDHAGATAELYAELFDEERKVILSSNVDRKQKGVLIGKALERLAREAFEYLPKCEVEVVYQPEPEAEAADREPEPQPVSYAYMSQPEAKAFCVKNPDFKVRPFQYVEPDQTPKPPGPLYSQDLDRIEAQIIRDITDKYLDDYAKRNSFDEARLFAGRLQTSIPKAILSWAKVERGRQRAQDREKEELIHVTQNEGGGVAEAGPEPLIPPDKMSGGCADNPNEDSDLIFDTSNLAERPDGADVLPAAEMPSAPQPTLEPVTGSVNFDSSLEAALAYVRDGWAVVPCCQFDPATECCTGPEKHHEKEICKGKVPLLAGRKDAKPGDGYTAACRDKGKVADYYTRLFPDAGVAIRLDNAELGDCVLLDADVKDGKPGLESFDELDATFNLPGTLMAITPSGGRHYIFKLPEDLPADYLGSWTEIMPGLDLKVANKGLCHVEPTVGKTGIYRWVDPTAEIAELPRECCDYLHNLHEQEQQAKLEKSKATASAHSNSEAGPFDPNEDQSKYVKDVDKGDRHPRLRSVACALARRGANESQIVDVLKFHDSQFKKVGPTNDFKFMAHVAQGAVMKFGLGVAQ